jgi:hypothetical protein
VAGTLTTESLLDICTFTCVLSTPTRAFTSTIARNEKPPPTSPTDSLRSVNVRASTLKCVVIDCLPAAAVIRSPLLASPGIETDEVHQLSIAFAEGQLSIVVQRL